MNHKSFITAAIIVCVPLSLPLLALSEGDYLKQGQSIVTCEIDPSQGSVSRSARRLNAELLEDEVVVVEVETRQGALIHVKVAKPFSISSPAIQAYAGYGVCVTITKN